MCDTGRPALVAVACTERRADSANLRAGALHAGARDPVWPHRWGPACVPPRFSSSPYLSDARRPVIDTALPEPLMLAEASRCASSCMTSAAMMLFPRPVSLGA